VSANAAGKKGRAAQRPGRKRYDKELVRDRTLELLSIQMGPARDQGARSVWDCPACGKREKYSVVKATGKGGCLVADCRLAGSADVFAMLAGLEDLDYQADFLAVLARSYELLGLEPDTDDRGSREDRSPAGGSHKGGRNETRLEDSSPKVPPRPVPVPRRGRTSDSGQSHGAWAATKRSRNPKSDETLPVDLDSRLGLAAQAYERILELCPLESRDRRYLRSRGISYDTIRRGRFGTMTAPRAANVKAMLQRELGRRQLLKVPGFSEAEDDGRLKFTFTGNYILIPYHDARGRITTIEGRVVGDHQGPRKYVTLRRAGNHLYLFPGHCPEDLVAVCEGAMGAIVAAECGLPVGAIMGCERFRASPSPEMLDGGPEDPLLELKGADFGGRTVAYIPDADYPPNPNVLRAAPKAARWIAESQNGRPAICLLPQGADLDEWLLSLDPDERADRFAELLAGASLPEDAADFAPTIASSTGTQPDTDLWDDTATPDAPIVTESNGEVRNGGRMLTDENVTGRTTKASPGRKRKAKVGTKPKAETGTPQPSLWEELNPANGHADTNRTDERQSGRRGVSAGARKLRDEVYRTMIEALPPKEEHLRALEDRGVVRAAARVGRFASLDAEGAKKAASELAERFGAKRLLSVPGFEAEGTSPGKVRLSLASRAHAETVEHLLLPCFDAEGLLVGVEGLPFDPTTGEIEAEETVPLKGAGSHLYVFAHYEPGQVEGFCEGPLGAMLAAQADVVVGAIGGFRRYKAGSGPGEGRQPADAVLPELEGVDFGGRQLFYAPRAGALLGEANARYHEVTPAARWLVERQNGRAAVVDLRGDGESGEDRPGSDDEAPTSLGEWILSLPGNEVRDRLRELFPESPARSDETQEDEDYEREAEHDEEGVPRPLPTRTVYGALALAAIIATLLDAALLRLEAFAGYVGTGSGGEQVIYGGALGPLRRLADSAPFDILYELRAPVAVAAGLALTLILISRASKKHLARLRTARIRLEDRWELHLTPGKRVPSRVPITPGEALAAALAWPVAFLLVGWFIPAMEALLSLAARFEMVAEVGTLVANPTLASVYAATSLSALVLWRRRSIRVAESRMLRGKIRH